MKETRQLFICVCGCPEHQFIVDWWVDDDPYLFFHVHLTLLSFWRRMIVTFRYVFNTQKAAFEEVLLRRPEVYELRNALNEFLIETEPKEIT